MVLGLEKRVRNTRSQENAKHTPGILSQPSALCLQSEAKTERNVLFGNKGIVGKKGKKFGLHCRATGGGGQHTKSDLTQLQSLLSSLSHTLWFYPTLNWPLVSYPFLVMSLRIVCFAVCKESFPLSHSVQVKLHYYSE